MYLQLDLYCFVYVYCVYGAYACPTTYHETQYITAVSKLLLSQNTELSN
jgi:hypothetical protein